MDSKLLKMVVTHPVHFLAFGFGSGLTPKAPGTAGTIVAAILYLFLSQLSLVVYLFMLFVTFVFSVYKFSRYIDNNFDFT